MNKLASMTAAACFALAATLAETSAGSFNPERYEEADLKILKAAPEELKNDRIWFETRFVKYHTTFSQYMEKSGFEAGEDYMISVRPATLPVAAEKTDELTELVIKLKPGAKVKIYGKVKKFRRAPKHTRLPHYYVDLEQMVPVESGKKAEKEKDADADEDGAAATKDEGFKFKMPKPPRRVKRKY